MVNAVVSVWRAQNPIEIGWERLFEDNPMDKSSNNNTPATCTEVGEEPVFVVNKEVHT